MDAKPLSRARVLDGSALKLLAVVTMLIDHVAAFLLGERGIVLVSVGTHRLTLYWAMRMIGRLGFPLFGFLLAEGFVHTRDVRKYVLNLLFFALLSEIPWNLIHGGTLRYPTQNVFFTLLLGLLGMCVLKYCADNRWKQVLLLAGLFVLSLLGKADYGVKGLGFLLAMYLLRENRPAQAVVCSCFLSYPWAVALAFIPIDLYNGRRGFIRGRAWKYVFYAVYPAHLLLFCWLRKNMLG